MKFKNNDKVRILNKSHTFSGSSNIPNKECIGKIGYVWISDVGNMRVNSGPNDSGDYYGIFEENELELVNEHNFEVGKWYKIGEWRCKFLKLEGTKFWNSFAMTPYDGYISDNRDNPGYVDYSAHSYPELITDLTEIQQYLPDDHPDKTKAENLVGRYIKALVDYPDRGIVKKNEIGIIKNYSGEKTLIVDFSSQKGYMATYQNGKYELMPEGFVPNEIPEYVQLVNGWSANGEFMGEVFKLDDLSNLSKFRYAPDKRTFRQKIVDWINNGHFIVSTKEAYEAQFKTMEKTEFKKGDYVVLLASCDGGNCWKSSIPINYCYKLRDNYDNHHFYPELDNKGSDTNGWSASYTYDSKMKVRAATAEEISEYKRLGKPYDVTTLVGKEQSMEAILEEAKRRFPIGCKFKPVLSGGGVSDNTYEQTVACYIHKSSSGNWIIGSMNIRSPEGEWAELVSLPEESKSEEWIPKVGDWVWIIDEGCNINAHSLKPFNKPFNKPFKLYKALGSNYHFQFSLTECGNNQIGFHKEEISRYLKKAEPHEIPNEPKPEPMNTVKNYTIDEAYYILIQRGFNKVKRYYYRDENGNLASDVCSPRGKVSKQGTYIDFGAGYLWSEDFPHLIADVDMVVEWEDESSDKPTYSIVDRQHFTDKSQIIKGNKAVVISECRPRDSENYCRPGSLVTFDESDTDNPYVINENGVRAIMYLNELSPFEEGFEFTVHPSGEWIKEKIPESKRATLFFTEEIPVYNKSQPSKHWMLQTTLED